VNVRTVRNRTVAALAGAALVMGGAVTLAAPASAAPAPTWGRACPSGDSDPIWGGTFVKKWTFQYEARNRCYYSVKVCQNGFWGNCTSKPQEWFQKRYV